MKVLNGKGFTANCLNPIFLSSLEGATEKDAQNFMKQFKVRGEIV